MHVYDNQFAHANVYGHALQLITTQTELRGVHIDVGCSFGRIAEEIQKVPGLEYVGIDASDIGLASLRERGMECHQHSFGNFEEDQAFVRRILGGRRLRSVSILDTLEHLEDPEAMLRTLREICKEEGQLLVVSVPNVTHRDIGFKLAAGRWDYTPAGLLDRTHLRFFSNQILDDMTRRVGWRQVATNDVLMQSSDQRFPPEHLALADGSALNGLLRSLRDRVPHSATNQFVRAYLPDAADDIDYVQKHEQPKRPFLSVITRTQGKRIEPLRETLLCLAAQTCDDFEVVIVGHRLDPDRQLLVRRVIEESSDLLGDRVRLVLLDRGNRTTPLNVGFAEAHGTFISILDDDDIVMGNWVEEFKKLAEKYPGRMLRAVPVRQEFDEVSPALGRPGARAMSGMLRDYPPEFDLFRQLVMNLTPNMALAFPRSIFHDFGLRFDENLSTTEDWDFLMRAAFLCDVASTPAITSIYRWWRTGPSSRTEHQPKEWQANLDRILKKFDSEYLVLPPGSIGRLRELLLPVENQGPLRQAHLELLDLMQSRSWLMTMPLRMLGRALGNPPPITPTEVAQMTEGRASETLQAVRASKSMRVVTSVKRLRKRLRRS